MTRRDGGARPRQRVIAKTPWGGLADHHFIAGPIRQMGSSLVGGGASFFAYAAKLLAPELCPGDIVILDNLSSHKNEAVKARIEAAGATVMFLPPYSFDLNPIELMYSKLNTLLRKAAKRTVDALWDRLKDLLNHLPPQENAPITSVTPVTPKHDRKME